MREYEFLIWIFMTTGEGVFWGLFSIALVYLYLKTKESWPWRKIAKYFLYFVLGFSVVLSVWIAISNYQDAQPVSQSTYLGLKIGDDRSEVIFKKGKPSSDQSVQLFYSAQTAYEESFYVSLNDRGIVDGVMSVSTQDAGFITAMQRIGKGDNTKEINDKFGDPTLVVNNKEGTRRIFYFKKYGVMFALEKDKVIGVGIFDANAEKPPFSFKSEGAKLNEKIHN